MPRAIKPKVARHPQLSLIVQYAAETQPLPTRSQLRRWIVSALERDATITLRIVDADEAKKLNGNYRKKNYATNVLTFVYHEASDDRVYGDIVPCASVVADEAKRQDKLLMHHYAHMVIHGVLHLQGYDHEADDDANNMEQREIALLQRLKIPNPYTL